MSDPTMWWDIRLVNPAELKQFIEHLGPASMDSRAAARSWAKDAGFHSILDAGCGPALDTWEDGHFTWTGLDNSGVLIKVAAASRGVKVVKGSVEALPFEDEEFDVVYSRHVWEHLPDFRAALKEACRVAKYAVIITFFRPPGALTVIRQSDGAYYNDYALSEIEEAFHDAWPGCNIEIQRLPPAAQLPHGELILFVTL